MIKYFCFLFFYIFCLSFELHAQILMQESSVEYKDASKVTPHYRAGEGYIKKPQNTLKQENLIDTMDVYALSPHAKMLLHPRMVNFRNYKEIDNKDINWKQIIRIASQKHGIPEKLISAVIRTESNFIADAVSHVGAQGAMQIMPETAQDLGLDEPFNASKNVDAGTRYLKEQIARFKDLNLALAAYNAGPGNVMKYNGIPPFKETQNFVKKVLSYL